MDGTGDISSRDVKIKESRYARAGLLSKLTYMWMAELFKKSYQRPLQEEDIYEPVEFLRCDYNISRFEKKWEEMKSGNINMKGSLYWLIIWHFKRQLFLGYFLFFISEMCKFGLLLCLRYLIEFIEKASEEEFQNVWYILIAVVVLSLANGAVTTNSMRIPLVVELRAKIILSAMVYRKILRLSAKSFNGTSSGHIVSLMSADVEAFNLGFMFMYGWVFTPVTLLIVFTYESFEIGPLALIGVGVLILVLVFQLILGIAAGKLRFIQARWTDKRVLLLSEMIKAMKVIKIYCWEKPYAAVANGLRKSEMRVQLYRSMLVMIGMNSGYPVAKIIIYTTLTSGILTGHEYSLGEMVSLIGVLKMVELSFFRFLGPSFISSAEMIASSDRIKAFLLKEEGTNISSGLSEKENAAIRFIDLQTRWPVQDKDTDTFRLKNINLDTQQGELIAVLGKVGAGKTALLKTCLKEMETLSGKCEVVGSLAYAPQEPWITSETVRENIVFGATFDEERYRSVIKACALEEDISEFPNGDLTLVGERGLTLSGGQKARIGLARAVYVEADIYLLDDPLSAVDGKVGRTLFFECINGLLKHKLRILITHQSQFLPHVDRVLLIHEGSVISCGTYTETIGTVNAYIESKNKQTISAMSIPSLVESSGTGWLRRGDPKELKKDKNEYGAVAYSVYSNYLKAGRGIYMVPLFLSLLIAALGTGVLHDWMLVNWTNANRGDNWVSPGFLTNFWKTMNPSMIFDNEWYIKMLGTCIVIIIILYNLAFLVLSVLCKTAAERLYNKMFAKVIKAPAYFYETNPVGQILNRFSRDTAFMDILLLIPLTMAVMDGSPCIIELMYVWGVNQWCIIPTVLYAFFLLIISHVLLPGLRECKRIEASLRSPVFSELSSIIDGLSVIKAMKKEGQHLEKAYRCIDRHSSAWFHYVGANRAVSVCVDIVSGLFISMSVMTIIATYDSEKQSVQSVGLALVYLPGLLLRAAICFNYGAQVETMMTSVERIQQYSTLDQEAPDHEEFIPPLDWPREGSISFKNVSLVYRGQKRPSLGPLDVEINPGEKIGVVGRTGAGKSSIFTCLLRMVESDGSMVIDGIDVQTIGLADLRGRISVIPQDPVLFSRSLRYNLDPLDEFRDENLWEVLDKVELKAKVLELPGKLASEMGESGNNFSVGEKQLLCMARAVLVQNKVVLVDEATANVDNRTDSIIQESLRAYLSDATVITIAHRVNTLVTSDRIMVLEGGSIKEFDRPYQLLEKESSKFYEIVAASGPEYLEYFRTESDRLLKGIISTRL